MYYLSRLSLNQGRIAQGWLSNPYRIHQRLKMACPEDARILFRLEIEDGVTRLLVLSHDLPDWSAAFNEFPVLYGLPEMKTFDPQLVNGQLYAFRLVGNPTVKKGGRRLGLHDEVTQKEWLIRHLNAAGAEVIRYQAQLCWVQHSKKTSQQDIEMSHLLVQFDGFVMCRDSAKLHSAIGQGLGSAKSFGCGLLSLARA